MKKTLALFLALITILSIALVACKKNTPAAAPSDDEEDEGQYVSLNNPTDSDTSDTSDTSKDDTTGWSTLTDKKVYLMADNVNIRDAAAKNGKSLGKANLNDEFDAIAYNGSWYKISYDGSEAYIMATFVTTNKAEATFIDFAEADYETLVIDEHGSTQNPYKVNLRTCPALDEIYKTVAREATLDGQLVKIGENQSGNIWKVKYTANGSSKVCYIGKAAFINFDKEINEYGGVDNSRG